MSSESVHPTGPHAGQSSSVDPRTASRGRRFVQRGKKPKDSDVPADDAPHDALLPPPDDEHQVDILA
ncbi:MAG: hypothetical protein ABFD92_04220 [Planctomycetaceae bacterium]|nr:hypothetical protein [Planctomycetaceae bacterium]